MVTTLPLSSRVNALTWITLCSLVGACGTDAVEVATNGPAQALQQYPEDSVLAQQTPAADLSNAHSTTTPTTPESSPQRDTAPSDVRLLLESLEIVEPASDLPAYNRSDWGNWRDEDSDCQNARQESLIAESTIAVSFRNSSHQCKVAQGHWLTPFSNVVVTTPSELDIDHMVPLKNAHLSGAWVWTAETKKSYFNDLSYENQLIAVTAFANRSKGARGPEQWKPENDSYWCQYAQDWIAIKLDWGLSANAEEWSALEEMIETCPDA